MKYLISVLVICCILLLLDRSFGSHLSPAKDSIFIQLPAKYDTLNVSFIGSDFFRIVFDKFSQKSYTAPEGTSLDVQRKVSFVYAATEVPAGIAHKMIDLSVVSDSLLTSSRAFFRRHNFFVVITKKDTCYFYRAKGEYMYKNYKNDVQ